MQDITIICDSREKSNLHIINYFNENNIKWKCRKLNYGDYSFELDGISHVTTFAIERKSGLDEISGNLTKGRERFAREFERAYKDKCKMILLIENASWEKIREHKYRSLFSPKAFESSLKTWSNKFMFDIEFVSKVKAGKFIYDKILEVAK